MRIRKAEKTEYEVVRAFYHTLIDEMQDTEYHPKWQKDIYPAPEDLRPAIENGELYLGFEGESIAAAMAVNHTCSEEYAGAPWPERLSADEFLVIHMLGVRVGFQRKGFAKEMVRFVLGMAEESGMKAVRLDVLEGNLPAERLYEGLGFRYVDTLLLFYEDTGRVRFRLYEYPTRRAALNRICTDNGTPPAIRLAIQGRAHPEGVPRFPAAGAGSAAGTRPVAASKFRTASAEKEENGAL